VLWGGHLCGPGESVPPLDLHFEWTASERIHPVPRRPEDHSVPSQDLDPTERIDLPPSSSSGGWYPYYGQVGKPYPSPDTDPGPRRCSASPSFPRGSLRPTPRSPATRTGVARCVARSTPSSEGFDLERPDVEWELEFGLELGFGLGFEFGFEPGGLGQEWTEPEQTRRISVSQTTGKRMDPVSFPSFDFDRDRGNLSDTMDPLPSRGDYSYEPPPGQNYHRPDSAPLELEFPPIASESKRRHPDSTVPTATSPFHSTVSETELLPQRPSPTATSPFHSTVSETESTCVPPQLLPQRSSRPRPLPPSETTAPSTALGSHGPAPPASAPSPQRSRPWTRACAARRTTRGSTAVSAFGFAPEAPVVVSAVPAGVPVSAPRSVVRSRWWSRSPRCRGYRRGSIGC